MINQTDFIFEEQPIINVCRKAMKRKSDYIGNRFIVYLGRVGKKFINTFEVYDRKNDVYYHVEYHRNNKNKWWIYNK